MGCVGGYYQWDNNWKLTGSFGVQHFGGAQLLNLSPFPAFTQPIARLDFDRMDDEDNRLFGITAQIAWAPKPSYQLTLRTPLYAIKELSPAIILLDGHRRRHLDAQPDNVILHPGRMRARTSLVRRDRRAALQLDDEIVQRTGDALVVDDALRQRSALVRTAIVEREHLVVPGPEHRDVPGRSSHDARAKQGDIAQRSDLDPLGHASSSSASGLNSL